MVRQQILKAKKYRRTELLNSQREKVHQNWLVFSTIYYPIFSNLKNILVRIHLLLTPHKEHTKVFQNIPIVSFRKEKI